jgi:hypothetical protein
MALASFAVTAPVKVQFWLLTLMDAHWRIKENPTFLLQGSRDATLLPVLIPPISSWLFLRRQGTK